MKLFLDTSALAKKYFINERGVEKVVARLAAADSVIVSPITRVEMYHAFNRVSKEGLLPADGLQILVASLEEDWHYFDVVPWNSALEWGAVKVLEASALRSLDAVQLAAGIVSRPDIFCTADRKLCLEARKYLGKVELIE
ncbi:MAG: type II toxin-antitoxin system VapC family toxin [Candidatus Omnitrophica bacterium]|nr:type II toxin-antitoxin system VapC family toxin [Candidatus Omnitrophota bacterium]